MELYGVKSKSIPQKTVIIFIEIILITLSFWILFKGGGDTILNILGINPTMGNYQSRFIIFSFSLIVFARMTFMMLVLLKRKIPWEESISVPLAFSLYYIGFPLLGYNRTSPIQWTDYLGIAIFITGSCLNTVSELQRHYWKKKPENKGKLFTSGLFRYSMHINYFGDVLWVSAYAIITLNPYAILVPAFLFSFFAFYNVPALDKYLAERYAGQFDEYKKKTKKLVPFVW